jgi:hypothetical protein
VARYDEAMTYSGRCHCGALRFAFETEAPLAPRACQCGFCRRHGARTVSDPAGSAVLTLGAETIRYRFGSGSTDFLICGRCGVYVGAMTKIDGALFATLNLNAFDDPRLDLAATPVSYDGEDADAKATRRHTRWTPLALA